MTTWWITYADRSKAKGRQFVGAAIVDAGSEDAAVVRARRIGLEPEVGAVDLVVAYANSGAPWPRPAECYLTFAQASLDELVTVPQRPAPPEAETAAEEAPEDLMVALAGYLDEQLAGVGA